MHTYFEHSLLAQSGLTLAWVYKTQKIHSLLSKGSLPGRYLDSLSVLNAVSVVKTEKYRGRTLREGDVWMVELNPKDEQELTRRRLEKEYQEVAAHGKGQRYEITWCIWRSASSWRSKEVGRDSEGYFCCCCCQGKEIDFVLTVLGSHCSYVTCLYFLYWNISNMVVNLEPVWK